MRLIDADALLIRMKKDALYYLVERYGMSEVIEAEPTVDAVQVIRCMDCKHFEWNHWENVNGTPLIVAHGICTKWGDGCKTSADGYCFLAERKE